MARYSIAMIPGVVIDGVERRAPAIMRHNDGSMVIMCGHPDGEDHRPALMVPMMISPKRGEAWKTSDPAQEAFAALVVDMLNAATGADQ